MTATLEKPPLAPAPTGPVEVSDRSRAERRLGLLLSTPGVLIMLLVTAYPLINAVYLSLFEYRLTSPDERTFVGLRNFATILGVESSRRLVGELLAASREALRPLGRRADVLADLARVVRDRRS